MRILAVAAIAALASNAYAGISADASLSLDQKLGSYYYYTITLHNTGDTDISSFWYAWEPDINFMLSYPYVNNSPSGWYGYATGGGPLGDGYDGYGIEWYTFGAPIAAGDSGTFGFYSYDSPAQLAGDSVNHPGSPVQTSYVYQGFPEGDPDTDPFASFVVSPAAPAPVPEPASLGLLAGGTLLLTCRRKR